MGAQGRVVGQGGFGPATVRYVVQRVLIVVTAWHDLIVPRSQAGDSARRSGDARLALEEIKAEAGGARGVQGVSAWGHEISAGQRCRAAACCVRVGVKPRRLTGLPVIPPLGTSVSPTELNYR